MKVIIDIAMPESVPGAGVTQQDRMDSIMTDCMRIKGNVSNPASWVRIVKLHNRLAAKLPNLTPQGRELLAMLNWTVTGNSDSSHTSGRTSPVWNSSIMCLKDRHTKLIEELKRRIEE